MIDYRNYYKDSHQVRILLGDVAELGKIFYRWWNEERKFFSKDNKSLNYTEERRNKSQHFAQVPYQDSNSP